MRSEGAKKPSLANDGQLERDASDEDDGIQLKRPQPASRRSTVQGLALGSEVMSRVVGEAEVAPVSEGEGLVDDASIREQGKGTPMLRTTTSPEGVANATSSLEGPFGRESSVEAERKDRGRAGGGGVEVATAIKVQSGAHVEGAKAGDERLKVQSWTGVSGWRESGCVAADARNGEADKSLAGGNGVRTRNREGQSEAQNANAVKAGFQEGSRPPVSRGPASKGGTGRGSGETGEPVAVVTAGKPSLRPPVARGPRGNM
jgi:hypothetical protein